MAKKLTKQDKEPYLKDVNPEHRFWVCNGQVISNMDGLMSIKDMSDEIFKYHVNKEKNDFSNWVNDVIGDKKLAKDLAKIKTKKAYLKKIKERLEYLKK